MDVMSGTFFKAVRPDGTSFNDPSFRWVPETGPVEGVVVVHPHAHKRDASGYLSVATVPTDCTGMWWPARLLIVEPVDGYDVFAPEPSVLPNKRAAHGWRVVGERPGHELLGPQGAEVVALVESFGSATTAQWDRVAAAGAVARAVARYAAGAAAGAVAGDAARDAARYAAWAAARYAAWAAAWAAARYAAWALTVRDLVGTADGWDAAAYDILTAPLRAGGFNIPEAPK